MKKNILFIIVLLIIFSIITAVLLMVKDLNGKQNEKIEVIATLFPQYDFVKQIGGDKVNVTLLLPPGTESHTYEPTPQDMMQINNSSLFIYTGSEMEPWAENLISGLKSDINVLDLSTTVDLINSEEFEESHKVVNNNHHGEEEHEHSYDPHIWLNPLYAIKMVESIEEQLCELDSVNKDYYEANSNRYIEQIRKLDSDFEETVKSAKVKKIAFGGAFAYAYFVERYNLDFISAYSTCGENAEPSTIQVKSVIDYMKKNKIPVIFYKEYTSGKVAKTISESTGSKMLVFNTVHNLSREEIDSGESYVSVMGRNLENLKIALGM